MPDTIYDELARATGWELTHTKPLTVWRRNGDKALGHPYFTIDAIDAEFRKRGLDWFKDERHFAGRIQHPDGRIEWHRARVTGDTRHDLATLLLRCVQQCGDQGQAARVPSASKGAVEKKSHDGRHGVDPDG